MATRKRKKSSKKRRSVRKPRTATSHSKAVAFFYKHAGYSYGPGESPLQGRRRGAIRLAKAEAEAARRGWRVKWEHDQEEYQMGDAETEHPSEVLTAVLYDAEGNVLGSLSGIGDPSRDYSRVVEADLALEALGNSEGVEKMWRT